MGLYCRSRNYEQLNTRSNKGRILLELTKLKKIKLILLNYLYIYGCRFWIAKYEKRQEDRQEHRQGLFFED